LHEQSIADFMRCSLFVVKNVACAGFGETGFPGLERYAWQVAAD
jgi:hypothetical protein